MRLYLILVLGFCVQIGLFAQDAAYSQFYNSNAILNPALIGVYDGQNRLTLNYRDQWSSIHRNESYRTLSAQFDGKVHMKRNDFLTYGLDFTRDQAGSSSYLQQNGHFNVGYIKQIGTNAYSPVNHFLVGALRLGFGQNRLSLANLWFGNQFNKSAGSIDFATPSNEELLGMGNTPLFGDFGMGLLYYGVIKDRHNFYAGFSANHLNQPRVSLTEFGDFRLKRLYVFHAGTELPHNRELSSMINVATYFQGASRMFMPGYTARYKHKDWKEIALRAGVWSRFVAGEEFVESFVFGTTFEYESILFGLSYDVTTSSLVQANSRRGSIELSFQYINRNIKYRSPITCPKF